MEDIVAVTVELKGGQKRYFLTWGRIQDNIAYSPLEAIVLQHARSFDLGGVPNRARVCHTLREASREPYFYGALFAMSQKGIPIGKGYLAWKKKIDQLMKRGKELYYLGKPKRNAASE